MGPDYLQNKVAIVTGAAVGLGNAYARALAAKGVRLGLCDVRPDVLELAEELPVEAYAWQGDVSDPAHVREVVDGTREKFSEIKLLENFPGMSPFRFFQKLL